MQIEKSVDVSDTINEIIDLLAPLYESKISEGEDGIFDFVAAMFGAITKLCDELGISQENSEVLFDHMWDVLRKLEDEKELN